MISLNICLEDVIITLNIKHSLCIYILFCLFSLYSWPKARGLSFGKGGHVACICQTQKVVLGNVIVMSCETNLASSTVPLRIRFPNSCFLLILIFYYNYFFIIYFICFSVCLVICFVMLYLEIATLYLYIYLFNSHVLK